MGARALETSGRVERDTADVGSKSERAAVVLTTREGDRYVLRRQNGPAFGDDELDALVGRQIRASGVAVGDTLVMRDWAVE